MTSVYVLKLKHDKYYIGKSKYVDNRIRKHFKGLGAVWTKKHKPLSVVEIVDKCDDFDEDKYTKMYMNKYGIDNVRGGSYCQTKLDPNTVELIEKEMKTSQDLCYRCDKHGHFYNSCKETLNYKGVKLSSNDLYCSFCKRTFYAFDNLTDHQNVCNFKKRKISN
jgi:predicted GIY-YIG superfamily endonuclease